MSTPPVLPLRVGTLNVRSTQGGNLEATLKSFRRMGLDIAVLTETKLTHDRHTTFRFGYSVCASQARSSSQGGVALVFNRYDDRFDMSLFRRWGPDVVSIMMTSGNQLWLIVGVYIPPTTHKDIYEATLEDIYKAAAVAQGEGAQLLILGDINVDLHGVTNPRMDLLHGTFEGQDERRASTISTLSSLGVEDVGRRFLQRRSTGIWTWGQVRQGKQIRSVCDYILMDPKAKVLSHRIRRVPGCSTDHRMVYVDIPHGNLKIHRKKKWGLQKWPLPQGTSTQLDRTFDTLRKAIPKQEEERAHHDDWISPPTWKALHQKAQWRWRRTDVPQDAGQYQHLKRQATWSLHEDRKRRMEKVLSTAESMIDSDPKRSFQVLAAWYKRRAGVNLPLARCEMEELETEYTTLYQAAQPVGEPLRGQVGTGFSIPDEIPQEKEIRKALGRMRRGKAPGPSRIKVDDLKEWAHAYEEGVQREASGWEIPESVHESVGPCGTI